MNLGFSSTSTLWPSEPFFMYPPRWSYENESQTELLTCFRVFSDFPVYLEWNPNSSHGLQGLVWPLQQPPAPAQILPASALAHHHAASYTAFLMFLKDMKLFYALPTLYLITSYSSFSSQRSFPESLVSSRRPLWFSNLASTSFTLYLFITIWSQILSYLLVLFVFLRTKTIFVLFPPVSLLWA